MEVGQLLSGRGRGGGSGTKRAKKQVKKCPLGQKKTVYPQLFAEKVIPTTGTFLTHTMARECLIV